MHNRIDIIQELVRTRIIRSQEELLALLAQRGVQTTQATLSRDLKKLQISKRHDASGGYHYVLPEPERPAQDVLLPGSRAGESIVSLAISGQMGVIKTLPGCAGMVGALVDAHTHPALLGTIAGEDTLLLILREQTVPAAIVSFLEGFLPGIGKRLIK